MQIETRNFGIMEIDTAEVVTFRLPIFGFEEQRDYVLLSDSTVGDCFLWLQSIHEKDTCFMLVTPDALPYAYQPVLPPETLSQLELPSADDAILRVVAVIPEQFTEATVNLKSPIVVNALLHIAGQVMLEEEYPIRAPLVGQREEVTPC